MHSSLRPQAPTWSQLPKSSPQAPPSLLRSAFLRMASCTFDPSATVDGELPPWEVAKAFAYHVVLYHAAKTLGAQPSEMLGQVGADSGIVLCSLEPECHMR